MRHTVRRLTALFIALMLALTGVLPASVFAEDAGGGIVVLENGAPEDPIDALDGVPEMENETMVGEAGELSSLDLSDALSGDLLTENAPQPAPEAESPIASSWMTPRWRPRWRGRGTRSSALPIPPRRRGMSLPAGSWRMASRCLRTRTATVRSPRSSPTRTRCAPRSW